MDVYLGIDTSNYTTSAAAVDSEGNILADARRLLEVKDGERGLRQSHALFQHVNNLPEVVEEMMAQVRDAAAAQDTGCRICAVAASTRPRPVDGSYMPVFLAGAGLARSLAAAHGVPFFEFSHQEGHIAAVCGAEDSVSERLSFHLSGGTGEIVRVRGCMPLDIVGGIRDISFGQVIDRVGVAAGLHFPAGAELDRIACINKEKVSAHISRRGKLTVENGLLKPVSVKGAYADLSGIETQAVRALESGNSIEMTAPELFYHLSEALYSMVAAASEETGIKEIVFAGGVSASSFIRETLAPRLEKLGIKASFGDPRLSSDNACGTARLAAAAVNNASAE